MKTLKIPRPISGGLMLSYKCSAECKHCMYGCSPKWKGDWISIEKLEKGLLILSEYIQPGPYGHENMSLNHGLHFSGGEPFLNFGILLKAVEIAEELRIPSTFAETNCSWCKDDAFTLNRLRLLKEKGLKGIMISVNPFYAEYVPFERTDRCIRISQNVFGSNVIVYQMEYYRQFKRLRITDKISIQDYLNLAHEKTLSNKVELFLMGRAAEQLKSLYPGYSAERFFNIPCQPPILRNWHNHFDNYDNFMPGFCGGLSLGSWFDLDRIVKKGVDLEKRPILKYLINDDMKGLMQFAKNTNYEELRVGYVSKCHLCLDIRKHLSVNSNFDELNPKEFYKQFFNLDQCMAEKRMGQGSDAE